MFLVSSRQSLRFVCSSKKVDVDAVVNFEGNVNVEDDVDVDVDHLLSWTSIVPCLFTSIPEIRLLVKKGVDIVNY